MFSGGDFSVIHQENVTKLSFLHYSVLDTYLETLVCWACPRCRSVAGSWRDRQHRAALHRVPTELLLVSLTPGGAPINSPSPHRPCYTAQNKDRGSFTDFSLTLTTYGFWLIALLCYKLIITIAALFYTLHIIHFQLLMKNVRSGR